MQVAYIETDCRCCDDQGYEALVWDLQTGALRAALAHEDPTLVLHCGICCGSQRVRIATLPDPAVQQPLSEDEWCELLQELETVRERIRHQEEHGAGVWPELMARNDELFMLEDLIDLEAEIEKLERSGVVIHPKLLKHREDVRATARALLPPVAA